MRDNLSVSNLLLVWFPVSNCFPDCCAKFDKSAWASRCHAKTHARIQCTAQPTHNSSRIPIIEPKEAGSVPPMVFCMASKELRWRMEPMEEGKAPDNWLYDTHLFGLWAGQHGARLCSCLLGEVHRCVL